MSQTIDKAAQARRVDIAAGMLGTDRAGAVVHIRAISEGQRQELRSLVDWVIAYEDEEASW